MPRIPETLSKIEPVASDVVTPGMDRVIPALRSLGYSLEQAVADIVDNSIDAGARDVFIRFLITASGSVRILISDNGHGMDANTLEEAMRLGSHLPKEGTALGKFGLGLKLASISQCQAFTVSTKKRRGKPVARRWTLEGLKKSECDRFGDGDAKTLLNRALTGLDLKSGGTVVIWDDFDRLKISSSDPLTRYPFL